MSDNDDKKRERRNKILDCAISKIDKNSHFFVTAVQHIKQFHDRIKKWDRSEEIDFIKDFMLGEGADCVSAPGMAVIGKNNFKQFMDDQGTREIIKKLFVLKQGQTKIEAWKIPGQIEKTGYLAYLDRFEFERGNKPLLFCNRFLIMIFPEVFTTIADVNALEKTRKILEIADAPNISFEKLQYQIRMVTDEHCKYKNIEESEFYKAVIAWWIVECERELRAAHLI